MKRKSPVIIIVFSLITLTLGYLAYVKIIKPLYQNNLSQNFEIKLDKDRELGIGKSNSQGKIFAVEMELSGRSDNHFNLAISDEALSERRKAMEAKGAKAWHPGTRERQVSQALKAYAAMTTSAARGAVRDVDQLYR